MTQILDPVHPGEILREDYMIPLGLSITGFAGDLDIPPSRLSDIVNGKRAITPDTALRLEISMGVKAQTWLDIQNEYDVEMARRKFSKEDMRRIRPVEMGQFLNA